MSRRSVPLRVLGIAVLVVVPISLVTALPGAATASPARAKVVPRSSACTAPHLVTWFDELNPQGALGTIYYQLEFTNKGAVSCTMDGISTVWAVDLAGAKIGKTAYRQAVAHHVVTLRANGTASELFGIRYVAAESAACKPVLAAGLRVFPPLQPQSETIALPVHVCSSTTVDNLYANPVGSGVVAPPTFGG
jgi:hypothetical protein